MKKTLNIAAIFIIIFLSFILVACNDSNERSDESSNNELYSITYVTNFGKTPNKREDVKEITKYDLPELYDEDYEFDGWYYDSDYKLEAKCEEINYDVILYGKWIKKQEMPAKTYTITYVSEYGTKPADKTNATYLSAVDLAVLTDDNNTFIGWYTDSTFTTPAQTGGLSSNVTLYAKWSSGRPASTNTYTITYVSEHGTKPSNKTNVTTITSSDLPILTDVNYNFSGWYTNSAFTNPAQTGALSSNVTLYARWIAKSTSSTYTNPTENQIINQIKKVTNVKGVESKVLNGSSGVIYEVYFELNDVDQSWFDETSIAEKGTSCGGCVEVYGSLSNANSRNSYLANFDGTWLDSGSHTVYQKNTSSYAYVIRISSELSASKQSSYTNNIINQLKTL